MDNILAPLAEDELNRLDQFLRERVAAGTDTTGKDEGVAGLSELDGLFTAIVSAPVVHKLSEWLPAVWGDFEPVWENDQAFEDIFQLLIRHMNGITAELMGPTEAFEPLFLQTDTDGTVQTIVDDWCKGYMRGVILAATAWDVGGEKMNIMLMPIMAFATERGAQLMENMGEEEVKNIRDAVTPCAREIHAFWLAHRQRIPPKNTPFRAPPQVGRNDPCPCGSGKKFKHCCLH
ncbi:MAG: UPF0149 family protein [Gammaproteobacteria bacterium]|nr:UPF0149 family protein [Gammaproteobacteria bacterium]